MFEGSSSILFSEELPTQKQYKAFLCQNRPTTKRRVYFDGHTVPKFAWYGQMTDGTRFIVVKNGNQYGMISHHELTPWSNEFVTAIFEFVQKNSCDDPQEITKRRTHIGKDFVIRKEKHKSRLPSGKVENYAPHVKMASEYKNCSIAIYGQEVDVNGKKYDIGTSRMATYMDGTGMGPNFDNSDRRPLEPQFPVKSGKRK